MNTTCLDCGNDYAPGSDEALCQWCRYEHNRLRQRMAELVRRERDPNRSGAGWDDVDMDELRERVARHRPVSMPTGEEQDGPRTVTYWAGDSPLRRAANDDAACEAEARSLGEALPLTAWTSSWRRCMACCIGAILEVEERDWERLAVLPESFICSAEDVAEYNRVVEREFGHSLRQLPRPPAGPDRLWIACLKRDDENGHAVVARGRDVVYDPAAPDGGGYWGQMLPPIFGEILFDGLELVPA